MNPFVAWLAHFMRFLMVTILLNIAGILVVPALIWLAFMLRATGRRGRDLLLIFVPFVGLALIIQTIWRYSATSVYWPVREDLKSKTLLVGNQPPTPLLPITDGKNELEQSLGLKMDALAQKRAEVQGSKLTRSEARTAAGAEGSEGHKMDALAQKRAEVMALTIANARIADGAEGSEAKIMMDPLEQQWEKMQRTQLTRFKPQDSQAITPASSSGQFSIADELTKLVSLRNQGVLTDSEFHEQKSRLLTESL